MNSQTIECAQEPSFDRQVLAPANAGVLRWNLVDNLVWWSAEMYRLHDYEPGEVQPSLELLFTHQHLEDRDRAQRAFDRIRHDGRAFTFEHRLITRTEVLRTVVLAVTSTSGPTGRPEWITGISLNVTQNRRLHHATTAETFSGLQTELAKLNAGVACRELINQATGILMERHKLPKAAAALLTEASQQAGCSIAEVAAQLVTSGELPGNLPARHVPKPSPAVFKTRR